MCDGKVLICHGCKFKVSNCADKGVWIVLCFKTVFFYHVWSFFVAVFPRKISYHKNLLDSRVIYHIKAHSVVIPTPLKIFAVQKNRFEVFVFIWANKASGQA